MYSHVLKKSSLVPEVQDQLSSIVQSLYMQQLVLPSHGFGLSVNSLKFENIPYLGDLQLERLIECIHEPQFIKILSLKNCPQLTDKSLELLLDFPNLEVLDLSHNSNFTFKGFKSIQELKNLKELHINWENGCTVAEFSFLLNIQNLPKFIFYTTSGVLEWSREFSMEMQQTLYQLNKTLRFKSKKLDTSSSSPIACAESIFIVQDLYI